MGIVIRVLYNNQNWQAPCEYPGKDTLCSQCFEGKVNIRPPKQNDEVCSGLCWEQGLRTNYEWGCTPKGRKFNSRKAYQGAKVFFVFRQPDGNYTLWAKTTVESVNVKPRRALAGHEEGYHQFMRFNAFKPLPKLTTGLFAKQLVGKDWRMGRFRYITAEQENHIEGLIVGTVPEKAAESSTTVLPPSKIPLNLVVTPTMYSRLESAAKEDGRQIDEIVREAIAEWLKGR